MEEKARSNLKSLTAFLQTAIREKKSETKTIDSTSETQAIVWTTAGPIPPELEEIAQNMPFVEVQGGVEGG